MIRYGEFADRFKHPAMIAKSGINHGVDVIDPEGFDAAMAALKADDEEMWHKIATFMESAPRPLVAGHYFPESGDPGAWYNWKAGYNPAFRWHKKV